MNNYVADFAAGATKILGISVVILTLRLMIKRNVMRMWLLPLKRFGKSLKILLRLLLKLRLRARLMIF